MSRQKPYTPDSLERALQTHVAEGRLQSYKRLTDPRCTPQSNGIVRVWQVEGNSGTHSPDGVSLTLNDRECYALCFGLASSKYKKEA